MSWNPIENPVDYVILDGKRTPGLADISGASSPRKWDERKGMFLSGARVVYRGLGLAKFTLRLRLYTIDDWRAWDDFAPTVKAPPRAQRAQSLDIWHPHLEALGIRSVVVEEVLQPEQTADGEWTIAIKLIEFRRPLPAGAIPDGSRQAEEVDPVQQQIQIHDQTNQILRDRRDALARQR